MWPIATASARMLREEGAKPFSTFCFVTHSRSLRCAKKPPARRLLSAAPGAVSKRCCTSSAERDAQAVASAGRASSMRLFLFRRAVMVKSDAAATSPPLRWYTISAIRKVTGQQTSAVEASRGLLEAPARISFRRCLTAASSVVMARRCRLAGCMAFRAGGADVRGRRDVGRTAPLELVAATCPGDSASHRRRANAQGCRAEKDGVGIRRPWAPLLPATFGRWAPGA